MDIMLVSTLRQLLRNTGYNTHYFLPDFPNNSKLNEILLKNKMEKVERVVWVPPQDASKLDSPFFSKRSVEKIPPVLKAAYLDLEALKSKYGSSAVPTIALNSDFDETWISSVFLLDYFATKLAAANENNLTNFKEC